MDGAIQLTTEKVPVSDELQKACRIPLFSVVQPMLPKSDPDHLVAVSSEEIARCQDCLAYINHLCPFETQGWVCSLCGTQNEYSIVANRRYFGGAQARQHLPELKPGIVEAIVPMAAASEIHENNGGHNKILSSNQYVFDMPVTPYCIALVDISSDPSFIEVVKSSLLAGIEALTPGTKFGLIAFGGMSLALLEPTSVIEPASINAFADDPLLVKKMATLKPAPPLVHHVPVNIAIASADPTPVDLSSVLPLDNLCACISTDKNSIIAAIESLSSIHQGSCIKDNTKSQSAAATTGCQSWNSKRPLGEALQAVLRYYGTSISSSTTRHDGSRLLLFLNGPCTIGRGTIITASSSATSSASTAPSDSAALLKRSTSAAMMMDPMFPEVSSWSTPYAPTEAVPDGGDVDAPSLFTDEPIGKGALNGWLSLFEKRLAASLTPSSSSSLAASNNNDTTLAVAMPRVVYSAAQFYDNASDAAVALGLSIDIYAATTSSSCIGLELLHTLTEKTGGTMLFYAIPDSHHRVSSSPSSPPPPPPSSSSSSHGFDHRDDDSNGWDDACSMPLDVYKSLSEPRALSCLLRLRTSPELKVDTQPLGSRLRADPSYEDLFNAPCIRTHDAFAVELHHASSAGFAAKNLPVIQVVLQYTHIDAAARGERITAPGHAADDYTDGDASAQPSSSGRGDGNPSAPRNSTASILQRRMRIITVPFGIATTAREVYSHCNAHAILISLMLQSWDILEKEGVDLARQAVLDGFCDLVAAYHDWVTIGEYASVNTDSNKKRNTTSTIRSSASTAGAKDSIDGDAGNIEIDPSFSDIESMQQIPRLIYVVLQSPLLCPPRIGDSAVKRAHHDVKTALDAHADGACALRMLWETLPPRELSTAIYPHLSSWHSPDELSFPRHSLSRAALSLSRQPIYLLDAFYDVIVYYNSMSNAHDVAFPPPQGSALRDHVTLIRHARRITPKIAFIRQDDGGEGVFTRWLIEDGEDGGGTFVHFLNDIKTRVAHLFE